MIKHVRRENISSRIGGDEFIVVLPDTTKKAAQKRAELLHDLVREIQIQSEDKVLEGISISGGVAAFPKEGSNCSAIFKAADQALYRTKHEGRDRIIVASD